MSASVRPIPRPRRKNTLRDHITAAIKDRPEIDFKFVRMHQHRGILDKFAERFLEKGRMGLSRPWPWEVFLHQVNSSQPGDVIAELEKRLTPTQRYWFIASDHGGKYWVADATGSGIAATLRETYHFEYYITDRKMTWALCENHHQILIEAVPSPERRK